MRLVKTPDCIKVFTPYNKDTIDRLKSIQGGKYNSEGSYWSFPLYKYTNLIDLRDFVYYKQGSITLEEYMIKRGYSPKTIKSYLGQIQRFLEFATITDNPYDELNKYILYLLEERGLSYTYVNQAISAAKLYLKLIQGNTMDESLMEIPRAKKERKLPKVLSKEEVKKLLTCTENEKHKTMLMIGYSCGLRVSEVAALEVKDIDSKRMCVKVCAGKGRKDRITTLSQVMLDQLRSYYKSYHPYKWLFENKDGQYHITTRTIQRVFNKSAEKAGINKEHTYHSFRHSFATHLLESGVDIRIIQELLGHESTLTTEIYTHVSTKAIQRIVNPLDSL